MPDRPLEFITVSRTPQRVQSLRQSLALATAGAMPHQLTVIDGNTHDLFTGYNAGAAQTTGEILIFIHDDVQLLANPLAFGRPLWPVRASSTPPAPGGVETSRANRLSRIAGE
jgi:hypothetical protein